MSSISYAKTEDGKTLVTWSSGSYNANMITGSTADIKDFVTFLNTVLAAMSYQA